MKKILLATLHSQNNNFGSVLQANSLYSYLTEKGFDVTVLDYRPYYSNGSVNFSAKLRTILVNTIFLPFFARRSFRFNKILSKEKLSTRCSSIEEIHKLSSDYDIFMVGSDQVWNPTYLCGQDPVYYLEFVNSNNKITYAASLGTSKLTEEQLRFLIKRTESFKYISLRENESVKQLQKLGAQNVEYVLDPVFLYTKEHYMLMQKNTDENGYILAYVIHKDSFISEVIDTIAKKLNKRVIQVGGFQNKCNSDRFPRSAGPAEFLGLIEKADFVITSSFHGTAFSHIYEKQFVVVLPHENTMRITDLLETAGTVDRVINNLNDIDIVDCKIDYSIVRERIDNMRQKSYAYLNKALSVGKN